MSKHIVESFKFTFLTTLSMVLFLTSCGQYDKLLKSPNNELKYSEAKKYYNDKHYMKAYTLLEDVSNYYKGTSESHEVLFLIAESYRHNHDYIIANNYYNTYTKSFPAGSHIEEAWYYSGESLYELSPDPRLDQTETQKAIESLELYVQYFPNGKFVTEANQKISEMRNKLAQKAYYNAKLYYNLGNYLGNNYLSAVVTAQNAIKDYPESKFREDLSFLVLKAKYEQAKKSVQAKKNDRYIETVDEYYNFKNLFPESKYIKDANKILEDAQKNVKTEDN